MKLTVWCTIRADATRPPFSNRLRTCRPCLSGIRGVKKQKRPPVAQVGCGRDTTRGQTISRVRRVGGGDEREQHRGVRFSVMGSSNQAHVGQPIQGARHPGALDSLEECLHDAAAGVRGLWSKTIPAVRKAQSAEQLGAPFSDEVRKWTNRVQDIGIYEGREAAEYRTTRNTDSLLLPPFTWRRHGCKAP